MFKSKNETRFFFRQMTHLIKNNFRSKKIPEQNHFHLFFK